jgi:hypothetical protein
LGQLLTADPTLSAQQILDRLVAFIFSPQGAETRAQLAAGLQSNGRFDVERLLDLSSLAGRLNPGFRASSLLLSVGGYLFSQQGKPVRDDLVQAFTQRLVSGLLNSLKGLGQPAPRPTRPALATEP